MATIYQVLVPELATVVLKDDRVIAYGFMMPSMKTVLQKARGNLVPFGIIPYIKAMKNIEVADMMSIGVTKDHNNKGAVALIMNESLKGLIKLKVKYLETGPELETNQNVQNLWKNYECQLVKRRRCWGLKV